MAANGDSDMDAFGLLLAFDTDAPAFARGFEAGSLWEQLRSTDGSLDALIHASNSEMVLRMGEALGRSVVGEPQDSAWTLVAFGEPGSAEVAGPSPRPGLL